MRQDAKDQIICAYFKLSMIAWWNYYTPIGREYVRNRYRDIALNEKLASQKDAP